MKREKASKIPPSPTIRHQLVQGTQKFVDDQRLTPPLTLEELEDLAKKFLNQQNHPSQWTPWTMILINNALWRPLVEKVPHQKRLLLLPKCLRNTTACQAPIDEYGLLCQSCGSCIISDLQDEADELGMMSMVAEGSTFVADLLESGSVEAIIGASCLHSLEKAFPYMVKNAVPGLALSLNCAGCKDTEVDVPLLREAFEKYTPHSYQEFHLKKLQQKIRSWFSPESLDQLLGPAKNQTEVLTRNWLSQDGKRHRPFLAGAVAQALDGPSIDTPAFQRLALAIECFHKASLIHDDIEDQDLVRYDRPTLHAQWGVALAINAGDFLLGLGYHLIGKTDLSPSVKVNLFRQATSAHTALCCGQGAELHWQREQGKLTVKDVLAIFGQKTAPAFEVALAFGAIYGEADQGLLEIFKAFSQNLGVAYQILDDLEDYHRDTRKKGSGLSLIQVVETEEENSSEEAYQRVLELYGHYRRETLKQLQPLKNFHLKGLLFRVTYRILKDVPLR